MIPLHGDAIHTDNDNTTGTCCGNIEDPFHIGISFLQVQKGIAKKQVHQVKAKEQSGDVPVVFEHRPAVKDRQLIGLAFQAQRKEKDQPQYIGRKVEIGPVWQLYIVDNGNAEEYEQHT